MVGKSNGIINSPKLYIFTIIQRIMEQLTEKQNVALKDLQNNAFALLSENIIFSIYMRD